MRWNLCPTIIADIVTINYSPMPHETTDAELEKFIEEVFEEFHAWDEKGKCIPSSNWDKACAKVAAFAAKRAREKAIEECIAQVPKESEYSMGQYKWKASRGGDEENFAYGYFKAYEDIHGFIEKLKS
jgi:hypothetical protein